MSGWRRVLAQVRAFLQAQERLHQRYQLLNRPWEEEFTHWARAGNAWTLHGRYPPPADGRRRSTTSDGWCPRC